MENIFAVYKPKGPTSHDIVALIKKKYPGQKVGHAGTLDPLASGVLVIAVGREATKKLSQVVAKEKEYLATIRLGETSTTDDAEGEKSESLVANRPTHQEIEAALATFIGEIEQVPPAYSAVKIKGKKAYQLARAGRPAELKPRRVEIKAIKLLQYRYPELRLRIVTGPGTYIRALARDLGRRLGGGAYLAELERCRVGEFDLAGAKKISDLS